MSSSNSLPSGMMARFIWSLNLPALAILSALGGLSTPANAVWAQEEKGGPYKPEIDDKINKLLKTVTKQYNNYIPEFNGETRMTIWEFHRKLKRIPVRFGTSWPGSHGFIVAYFFDEVGFRVYVDLWERVVAISPFDPRKKSPPEDWNVWWGLLPGHNRPYEQPPLIEIDRFLPEEPCDHCPCGTDRDSPVRRQLDNDRDEASKSQSGEPRSPTADDKGMYSLEENRERESVPSDPWKRWTTRIPDIRGRTPMTIREFHRKLKWLPRQFWSARPTKQCSLVWYDFGWESGGVLVLLDEHTRVLGVIDYRQGKEPKIQRAYGARWNLLPGRNKPYEQPPLIEIDQFLPGAYQKTDYCPNCHCETRRHSRRKQEDRSNPSNDSDMEADVDSGS